MISAGDFRNGITIEYDKQLLKSAIQRTDEMTYEEANPNPDPDYAPKLIYAEVLFHHEYSAGGLRRGKNHHLKFQNITLYGKQPLIVAFKGYDEAHMCSDIIFENLVWNEKHIADFSEITYSANEFCENITIK